MKQLLAFILVTLIISACSNTQPVREIKKNTDSVQVTSKIPDYYDSIYPLIDPSKEFEKFSEIIKRIQITTYYTTYYFDENQRITPAILKFQRASKLAKAKYEFNYSKTGTAVGLQCLPGRLILMTCEHVVNVADTIYVFQNPLNPNDKSPISSVSILNRKEQFIFGAPRLSEFTVIATERETDLALIISDVPTDHYYLIPTLEISLGDESRLKWGSIVYNFGFPIGTKMMVQGIVSNPTDDSTPTYTHNALFNRGLSGGLVVALRGDSPNFEWVGISNASSATTEYNLKPSKQTSFDLEERQIYSDTVFVEKQVVINQGISKSIKPSVIRNFIKKNSQAIDQAGFDLTKFVKKTS
jgi:S1-C subfamily serine protease